MWTLSIPGLPREWGEQKLAKRVIVNKAACNPAKLTAQERKLFLAQRGALNQRFEQHEKATAMFNRDHKALQPSACYPNQDRTCEHVQGAVFAQVC